jgi:hypothetical protein
MIKVYNSYATEQGYMLVDPVRGLSLRMPCIAMNLLESTHGKFADYDTNHLVIMEYDKYLMLMADYLPIPLSLNSNFTNFIRDSKNVNLESYAD